MTLDLEIVLLLIPFLCCLLFLFIKYAVFASGTSTDCVLSIGFHRNPSMEAQRPTLGKRPSLAALFFID